MNFSDLPFFFVMLYIAATRSGGGGGGTKAGRTGTLAGASNDFAGLCDVGGGPIRSRLRESNFLGAAFFFPFAFDDKSAKAALWELSPFAVEAGLATRFCASFRFANSSPCFESVFFCNSSSAVSCASFAAMGSPVASDEGARVPSPLSLLPKPKLVNRSGAACPASAELFEQLSRLV